MQSHRVDLAALDGFVADMGAFDAVVEERIAVLDEQMARLHAVWVGQAATAQRQAHAELLDGLTRMRTALQHLQDAARTAHANYTAAATANTTMFGQVG